jgi:glucose-1-phosphate adenylyltransferase
LAEGVDDKPFIASMGVYLFSRDVLLEVLRVSAATDFGRELIPWALDRCRVNAYVFDGYWADVGTIESFYHANIMLTQSSPPFTFHDSRRPIYTHPRFLPGAKIADCTAREAIIAEGCFLGRCTVEQSIVGIRSIIGSGTRITRSVLLGADLYEDYQDACAQKPRLGIGCDVVLDRVIIDKNVRIGDGAMLVNEHGHRELDGQGFYIRNGIIIVPKDGVIKDGTRV